MVRVPPFFSLQRYIETDISLSVHSASYVALTSIERMVKNKKLYSNKTSIDLLQDQDDPRTYLRSEICKEDLLVSNELYLMTLNSDDTSSWFRDHKRTLWEHFARLKKYETKVRRKNMAIDREARKKRTKRLVCWKFYILMIDVLEGDQRVVSWLSSCRHLNGMQGLLRFGRHAIMYL